MWFAAMSSYRQHPWFINFMAKLLQNDAPVLSLLQSNPFRNQPPKWVRARLYEYHFATPEGHKQRGDYWVRVEAGIWFPAVSLQNESLRRILQQQGWL